MTMTAYVNQHKFTSCT